MRVVNNKRNASDADARPTKSRRTVAAGSVLASFYRERAMQSSFLEACEVKDEATLKRLVGEDFPDVTLKSFLTTAAKYGYRDVVASLMKKLNIEARPKNEINKQINTLPTLSGEGDIKVIQELLNDPQILASVSISKKPILDIVIKNVLESGCDKGTEIVELFIEIPSVRARITENNGETLKCVVRKQEDWRAVAKLLLDLPEVMSEATKDSALLVEATNQSGSSDYYKSLFEYDEIKDSAAVGDNEVLNSVVNKGHLDAAKFLLEIPSILNAALKDSAFLKRLLSKCVRRDQFKADLTPRLFYGVLENEAIKEQAKIDAIELLRLRLKEVLAHGKPTHQHEIKFFMYFYNLIEDKAQLLERYPDFWEDVKETNNPKIIKRVMETPAMVSIVRDHPITPLQGAIYDEEWLLVKAFIECEDSTFTDEALSSITPLVMKKLSDKNGKDHSLGFIVGYLIKRDITIVFRYLEDIKRLIVSDSWGRKEYRRVRAREAIDTAVSTQIKAMLRTSDARQCEQLFPAVAVLGLDKSYLILSERSGLYNNRLDLVKDHAHNLLLYALAFKNDGLIKYFLANKSLLAEIEPHQKTRRVFCSYILEVKGKLAFNKLQEQGYGFFFDLSWWLQHDVNLYKTRLPSFIGEILICVWTTLTNSKTPSQKKILDFLSKAARSSGALDCFFETLGVQAITDIFFRQHSDKKKAFQFFEVIAGVRSEAVLKELKEKYGDTYIDKDTVYTAIDYNNDQWFSVMLGFPKVYAVLQNDCPRIVTILIERGCTKLFRFLLELDFFKAHVIGNCSDIMTEVLREGCTGIFRLLLERNPIFKRHVLDNVQTCLNDVLHASVPGGPGVTNAAPPSGAQVKPIAGAMLAEAINQLRHSLAGFNVYQLSGLLASQKTLTVLSEIVDLSAELLINISPDHLKQAILMADGSTFRDILRSTRSRENELIKARNRVIKAKKERGAELDRARAEFELISGDPERINSELTKARKMGGEHLERVKVKLDYYKENRDIQSLINSIPTEILIMLVKKKQLEKVGIALAYMSDEKRRELLTSPDVERIYRELADDLFKFTFVMQGKGMPHDLTVTMATQTVAAVYPSDSAGAGGFGGSAYPIAENLVAKAWRGKAGESKPESAPSVVTTSSLFPGAPQQQNPEEQGPLPSAVGLSLNAFKSS
jgi:hypothetical protein